ncbi:MAG: hypothetical protein PHR35_19505, partial [Kiritimatiellae bacterium]|nr:hypothetical protein [Kiritimatiellia bacterium]
TFAHWEVSADDNRAIGRTGGNMIPERPPAHLPWAAPYRRHARTISFYRTANLPGEASLNVTVELLPHWLAGGSPRLLAGAAVCGLAALCLAAMRRRKCWLAVALTLLALAAAQTVPGAIGVAIVAVAGAILAPICALARTIARARRRRHEQTCSVEAAPMPPPPLSPETEASGPDAADAPSAPKEGSANALLLTALAGATALLLGAHSLLGEPATNAAQQVNQALAAAPACVLPAPTPTAAPALILVDRLEADVRAPALSPDGEPVAEVLWTLRFRAEAPCEYLLFPAGSVISEVRADASRLRLTAQAAGTMLTTLRPGAHTLVVATRERVVECNGEWTLALPWPSNLFNRLTMTIPAPDIETRIVKAASLTQTGAGGATRVEAAIAHAGQIEIAWKPRARDTRTEAAVVYADAATLARLRPGVVEMQTRAGFNVVQGETREFEMTAPAGMTITAVTAPNLATWRFDPVSRKLQAILARPVSGLVTVCLTLQAPCGGLPYDWTMGVPAANGVQRQRGRVALAAPDEILARVGDTEGVAAIDTADFNLADFVALPPEKTAAAGKAVPATVARTDATLRRAFRYDDPATVKIALHAEEVQPEIRVSEASSFSVGDERNILSSSLDVAVAKSGVFSLRLDLPAGYEIETLTGRDVSHWDDARRSERGVEIFLTRRVQDATPINLVLSQPQRGIPPLIVLPRVQVHGAARHSGRIAVSTERGVKLVAEQLEAAVARRADEPPAQAGTLNFDILRPGWQVNLRTQVLAPVLKPEMLHQVELAEGMLRHRIHLRYRIENAGIKIFRVRVPVPEAPLTVTGRNIARVHPLDDAATASNAAGRVWEIELHGKVENDFSLVCQYQEPYDQAGGGVTIRPFEPLGAARQSGFLVITGGGRVQVEPQGQLDGLKPEDARTLPGSFGAGDLSGALRCYRVLRPDARLSLSVVRHAAAAVLPAQVEKVRLVTVLSGSGRLLTQTEMELQPGSLRFLRVVLPAPASTLWAALVNGAEAPVSRENAGGVETLSIALEGMAPAQRACVTLVYAQALPIEGLAGRHELIAPRFVDLPLRDIEWRLFVPPQYRWRLPDGDLDPVAGGAVLRTFGQAAYESAVQQAQAASLTAARGNLKSLDDLLSAGRQIEARNALQNAVNLSQGEVALNEDARVQFRNVVRQQVKMGLVNRRQALRAEKNIYDESAAKTQSGWNDGNFNAQYVQEVEEQLDAADRANLDRVADKMVEQQVQAAPAATAITIAMPEHGREFRLRRALLNERGGQLRLKIEARRPALWTRAQVWWPLIPVFLGIWLLLRVALGSAER